MLVDCPTSDVLLTHPFKDMLPDVDEFFENGVNTVNSFCNRVNILAAKYADRIDSDQFKGQALELLAEYMIRTMSHDNRIGIYDYSPVVGDDDVGVDGKGTGENHFPATVQVKFRRGDWILHANEDHLSNFLTASWNDFAVRLEDSKNMLIITTGLKVNEQTLERMLKNKVRVLNREALREMLDNRPEWWTRFYEAVKASRIKQKDLQTPTILRAHQTEGVEAAMSSPRKGMMIYPTGTGKTLVEAEIAYRVIREEQEKGNLPIVKFNSPRILLNFQLFEDVFGYLNSKGIAARYVQFCSGNPDDRAYAAAIRASGGVFREIVSTTSIGEVKEAYSKAKRENLPFVVFSTYHSSEKFAESGLVPSVTIHDEAHNLVSNEFHRAATLPSTSNFFFTATMKETDSNADLGMNNPDIFGEAIRKVSAKEMIDKGEMVPPWMHIVTAKNQKQIDLDKLDRDYDALVRSIGDAFLRHQQKIREVSYDASKIGAKVLVVCRGQQDLMEMFKSKVFEQFRKDYPDVHIFALSSDFGLYNDGEMLPPPVTCAKKYEFLKKVKALGPSEKCIVFHVDMIGEGIDIAGITGVMPFRNCELAKFCQNIGRASRLCKEDRKKFYAGEVVLAGRDGEPRTWIKPRSWIIIPSFLENSEGFEGRFREIIHKLREEYGYIPTQHTVIDNVHGLEDDEPIDTVNEKAKNRPNADSGIEGFEHEFEERTGIEKVFYEEAVSKETRKIGSEFLSLMLQGTETVPSPTTVPETVPEAPIPTPLDDLKDWRRTAKEVNDPEELRTIWSTIKGNGGTLSEREIEKDASFRLKFANGMTARRCALKWAAMKRRTPNPSWVGALETEKRG